MPPRYSLHDAPDDLLVGYSEKEDDELGQGDAGG